VGEAVKSLLAVMFPSDCRLCQKTLASFSRLPVCPACLESIQPILLPRCNRCGDLLGRADAEFGDACCPECSLEEPSFARAVNFGRYGGALRQLVHLLKYERVRPVAGLLGRLTAQACLQLEGDIDVEQLLLVPVPAHKSRLRSRGFNQAELIARSAQRGIEEAIGRKVQLETALLLRIRFTESQVALTAAERRQQIRGAFKVTRREPLKGREVLLVDDVMTTGATAAECARELRQAGASRVWVVTPARALGQSGRESLEGSTAGNSGERVSFGSQAQSFLPPAAESAPLRRHGFASNYVEQRVEWRPARARLL
jgi:ComF family protein